MSPSNGPRWPTLTILNADAVLLTVDETVDALRMGEDV
jgi:hypothetical protein